MRPPGTINGFRLRVLGTFLLLAVVLPGCSGLVYSDAPTHGDLHSECLTELPSRRVARLSDRHYANSVKDLLPTLAGEFTFASASSSPHALFEDLDRTPVSEALATGYQSAAEELSKAVKAHLGELLPCPLQTTVVNDCVQATLRAFVEKAYRRPISEEEWADYAALFKAGSEVDASGGMELVVQAVLQAASFLYRTELGGPAMDDTTSLTDDELASQLSYWLIDGPPDAPLRAAAREGSLSDPAGLQTQVNRLVGLPAVQEVLTQAHLRWAGLTTLPQQNKDEQRFPNFVNARVNLLESIRLFFSDVLWNGNKDLSRLYDSSTAFVDATTAPYFGVPAPAGRGFSQVQLPAERLGLLTHPAFLSRYASESDGKLIYRGVFIAREALCIGLDHPPATLDTVSPGQGLSDRQFAAYRAQSTSCKGCHAVIDPYGLTLTTFDAVGHYHPTDNGQVIDTHASVLGSDFDGLVSGPNALSQRMAQSKLASACMVSHVLSLGIERHVNANSCAVRHLNDAFVATGRQLPGLVVQIALAPEFRLRRQ